MRLIRQPIVHFLVLGVALFALQLYRQATAPIVIENLDAESRLQLRDDFVRQTGRMPTPSQVAALERQEMDSRILYAEALRRNFHRDDAVVLQRLLRDAEFLGIDGSDEEKIRTALALGVHESDEVIRRRMIQRMERVGRAQRVLEPKESELTAIYQREMERWLVPARYSFEHVFFSVDREGDAEARARQALTALREDDAMQPLGDPFLHGRQFRDKSLRDMTFMFGAQFSDALAALAPEVGRWSGPLPSAYGFHLLRISEVVPAKQRGFAEVVGKVEQLWRDEQERAALRKFIGQLRQRYVIADGEDAV